jgi:hypothetical protein
VICLVDSDIIYKLAMCNLLDESLTALDLARTDAYVLPTAKFKFGIARRRPGTGEQRYGAEVFARIRDFLGSAREIKVAGLSEELQPLASIVVTSQTGGRVLCRMCSDRRQGGGRFRESAWAGQR